MYGPNLSTPAFRGAYRKGYAAAAAGKPETRCPYKGKRPTGRRSWSETFADCWRMGWRDASYGKESQVNFP